MDQLGAIFKETREKQGKTLEDAVKETKIAKKYLIAIENENFDIFPGETYLIGFIRNYAQFLGLNPDEMIQRYKSYKIQEQPTPLEQLTARPRKTKYIVMLTAILGIVVISVVSYTVLNKKNTITVKEDKTIKEVKAVKKKESVTSKEYITMEESELIRDFVEGDV
ncbi:MAG: helix-turn-helix domain-containing protein, partial [Spirochaetes bacterium]